MPCVIAMTATELLTRCGFDPDLNNETTQWRLIWEKFVEVNCHLNKGHKLLSVLN